MKWQLLPAEKFARHAEQWRSLNAATLSSPLMAPEFVQALLHAFASERVLLAICSQHDQTIAMTLIEQRRGGNWEAFQPSQAPVSMWMHRQSIPLDALLSSLLRTLPGFPIMVGLSQRDPQLQPRTEDTDLTRTLDYICTARVDIQGRFDDYWIARGKNLRNNLKKQRNKLAKEGMITRLQIDRRPEQMAAAVADYGRLESAGWKDAHGTAIHPDNPQGRFYTAMLSALAKRDQACVYRYWFDEQLVAMDLCIEDADCLIVLKTTYDESVAGSLSPTLLMREECCRLLFDEARLKRLEFYGKVMEWHTRWTEHIRIMYHINHYRWPGMPQLHGLLSRLKRASPTAAPTNSLSTE